MEESKLVGKGQVSVCRRFVVEGEGVDGVVKSGGEHTPSGVGCCASFWAGDNGGSTDLGAKD